ncbi:ankyrin repeat-containing protein [Apiospora hydei]|uniref:Ankyrin repeat-containing protein n=1 Tax=Apiospora hydei TaxID=1337664 RepID=A0ABR1WSB4_9PEZI
MPSQPASLLPEWKWEKYKTIIWRLVFLEKLKPEELPDRMEALGLKAKVSEYKSHLRIWGFTRNNPEATRKYITNRVEKRQRQGKASAVIVSGVSWSNEKISKETCRNFHTTLEKLRDGKSPLEGKKNDVCSPNLPNAASPCTPPGPMVSVCTPASAAPMPCVLPEWSPELPWLRFTSMIAKSSVDILGMIVQRLHRVKPGPSMQDVATLGSHTTLLRVARQLALSLPGDSSNPIKISTHLRSVMPEAVAGEHLLRSQTFTRVFDSAAREFLIWGLYQNSNNFIHGLECRTRRDEFLLDLISQSGLVGSMDPILAEPTVASILEQVWRALLRRCRSRVVSWILDLGAYHNPPCDTVSCKPLSITTSSMWQSRRCCLGDNEPDHPAPISSCDVEETVKLLLAHGASPDGFCCRLHGTPLEAAIRGNALDFVELFVKHEIHTHGQDHLRHMDFDKLFCFPAWETPLASQHGMLDYLQSLSARTFRNLGDPFDGLLSTEGLIRAALYGGPALLSRLRAKGADFNCCTPNGEFPVGAVISHRYHDRLQPFEDEENMRQCEALVALSAAVNYEPTEEVGQEPRPSALHMASLQGHYGMVKALLDNGADLHTPRRLCFDGTWLVNLNRSFVGGDTEAARSPLSWTIWGLWFDSAFLLLESGAPIEGHELLLLFESLPPRRRKNYSQDDTVAKLAAQLIAKGAELDLQNSSKMTALDIAISKGEIGAASVLKNAGAAKMGSTRTTAETLDVLNTNDWLYQLKRINDSYVGCQGEKYDRFMADWDRQHPNESIQQKNARLEALVISMTFESFIIPLGYAVKHYSQAYSSKVLGRLSDAWMYQSELELGGTVSLMLPVIYELLRRRKLEYIDFEREMNVVADLVCLALHPRCVDVFGVLELLLTRPPLLVENAGSFPYHNPLIRLFGPGFHPDLWKLKPEETNRGRLLHELLDYGIKANTATGLSAIQNGCLTNELELLMDRNEFDPRRRYRWSHTALQYAVIGGNRDLVRVLLNRKVNVNGQPRWGDKDEEQLGHCLDLVQDASRTTLQFAVERGDWECIELLVEAGADVNAPAARHGGATALQLAAGKGYVGLVKWLIEKHGAEVTAPGADSDGITALEGAAAFGRLDVVGLLLEKGDFSEGERRRQYVRSVGYARRSKRQALSSYMERQNGWSKEDEESLSQEDLVESVDYFDLPTRPDRFDDYCRDAGCVGENESVDEMMEEPRCCYGNKDGISPISSCDEGASPQAAYPESRGNTALDLGGMYTESLQAHADSEARFGSERVAVTGQVIGEGLEDETFANENPATMSFHEWMDFNIQADATIQNEDNLWDLMDFS